MASLILSRSLLYLLLALIMHLAVYITFPAWQKAALSV
uniref:Uncharacterized protein n=1 Tax=Setaria italica TaxID=4555 RepID=K3Y455_SETIT